MEHLVNRLYTAPISAIRERVTGEITPVKAEQSATKDNNEVLYGAGNAIDLDLDTQSYTRANSDGTHWLKITLDKVHCVKQVIWYTSSGNPFQTWTCTESDCSNCVGKYCSYFTLTVSTEGTVSDLSPVSDCRYGDIVKLEGSSGSFMVQEIAIIGKEGKN